MSRLAAFQKGFVHAVVRAVGVGELGARRGFDVYRRNVVFAASDVFELIFPSVRAALGLPNLRFFVRELLTAHPPASASWVDASRPFPDFLRCRAELAAVPFIADLAQLDWLVARALRQPHTVPACMPSIDALHGAAGDEALIALNAMQTVFPVLALRQLTQAEWQDPAGPERVRPVPIHWLCVSRGADATAIEIARVEPAQ